MRRVHGPQMQVVDRAAELATTLDSLRSAGHSVGLVPTMGALHDGHRSLMRRAAQECDRIVVTIFVNPLQFGDPGDIGHYPRTLQADLRACQREGVAMVFAPPLEEMYPDGAAGMLTSVSVREVSEPWEGAARPGHFDGVTTVVAKLFAMCGRCRAYFGDKDFQQLAVVRRMVADLSFPVEVVGCPTVREPDGLALSSRNVRLSREGRAAAPVLNRALIAGRARVAAGEPDPQRVVAAMSEVVSAEPLAELDYAAVVDADSLAAPASLEPGRAWRLLVAAQVGPVRLIDNTAARVVDRGGPASYTAAGGRGRSGAARLWAGDGAQKGAG